MCTTERSSLTLLICGWVRSAAFSSGRLPLKRLSVAQYLRRDQSTSRQQGPCPPQRRQTRSIRRRSGNEEAYFFPPPRRKSAAPSRAAPLGLYHGHLNGTGVGEFSTVAVAMLGLVFAVFVLVAPVAVFVVHLRVHRARIAVRVAGGWIAASVY